MSVKPQSIVAWGDTMLMEPLALRVKAIGSIMLGSGCYGDITALHSNPKRHREWHVSRMDALFNPSTWAATLSVFLPEVLPKRTTFGLEIDLLEQT